MSTRTIEDIAASKAEPEDAVVVERDAGGAWCVWRQIGEHCLVSLGQYDSEREARRAAAALRLELTGAAHA